MVFRNQNIKAGSHFRGKRFCPPLLISRRHKLSLATGLRSRTCRDLHPPTHWALQSGINKIKVNIAGAFLAKFLDNRGRASSAVGKVSEGPAFCLKERSGQLLGCTNYHFAYYQKHLCNRRSRDRIAALLDLSGEQATAGPEIVGTMVAEEGLEPPTRGL